MLGIGSSTRMSSAGWPRFVTQALHRNVSLFVLVLLAIHVVAVILDDFVTITIADSFIPFVAVVPADLAGPRRAVVATCSSRWW